MEILYQRESYEIIGACMEVHRNLGCGFLESVYQEALAKEFGRRAIPFEKEVRMRIFYKGDLLQKRFTADFICYSAIIVELKAVSSLSAINEAQVHNYLLASGLRLGILVNFGEASLKYKRLIR